MSYRPRRGDYGSHYADDLIPFVERVSCSLGCLNAGSAADIAEYGPGGSCSLLAILTIPEEVADFEARPDGIHCSARRPLDQTIPLFEVEP